MNSIKSTLLFLIFLLLASCSNKPEIKILVYSNSTGFRHESIKTGVQMIRDIAIEEGWQVTHTEDSLFIVEENLSEYGAVIWLNTTGDVLDYVQEADFQRYIQAGGGFVGIHSATDTEYDWEWYGNLVGAYFKDHPQIQEATLKVVDQDHATTQFMGESFSFTEEWYNFKSIKKHINPLITLDETSYKGGNNGDFHPISWYHEFDGGRSFYTGLGHRIETYSNPVFMEHILEGIRFAIGNGQLDYSRAKTERIPDENRFYRDVLLQNLNEPMELDVIDDNTILFIERRGKLREFKLNERKVRDVAQLDVWYGLEEGLLGLAVDPNFRVNHWIYLYHSKKEPQEIHLSRFDYKDGILDKDSEKVLLKVPVERGDACCHEAGSIEFGPDGLLYLSTGDNTNPFQDGYAPIDERPGKAVYDAQRTAGNTNDLRGKILRIRPLDDGTYEIPEGNLFEPGMPGTRPEIYTMGLRNPFRISIDYRRNWLFWGDVGPDAGNDSDLRGPKGYDELNLAKTAGNFGWPYMRGNRAYFDYDYAREVSSGLFNLAGAQNNSPNNTGLEVLPPAQKSLIWYPYADSELFPWVKKGGRNAMAGPIYYADMHPEYQGKFPGYFEGKLFFYDWIRDWIFLLKLNENGELLGSTQFMSSSRFNNPIDMTFGKDGSLYILEYGESWNSQNMDARLNRITFIEGNRMPVARIKANKTSGPVPLTINFSGEPSMDFDGEKLKYSWNMGEGRILGGREAEYTFEKTGRQKVTLTVTDESGLSSEAVVEIMAGNSKPSISVDKDGDTFKHGSSINYSVTIKDPEDERSGGIDPEKLSILFRYLPEGEDLAIVGHQISAVPRGFDLMTESDCMACHAIDSRVAGPSFNEVAYKYSETDVEYLTEKIINGGAGVWGSAAMAAHPTLSSNDVKEMVKYILSLDEPVEENQSSLPPEGTLVFDQHPEGALKGKYVLLITYKDRGAEGLPSLSTQKKIEFHPGN